MVDSVQVPMLMARLPQPITNHFRLANPIELDGKKRGRGEGLEEHLDFIQRSWVFVFSCRLPLGYKSLLSSGKFSAVEHEGLNAIGFWWKTNLKKGKTSNKTRNDVLRISVRLVWLVFQRSAAITEGRLQQVCVLESNLKVDFRNGKWKGNSSCWTDNDHKELWENQNNDKRNLKAAWTTVVLLY